MTDKLNKLKSDFLFNLKELENVSNSSEQLQTEADETVKRLQKLETGYRKMEKEKNELIQVRNRGIRRI